MGAHTVYPGRKPERERERKRGREMIDANDMPEDKFIGHANADALFWVVTNASTFTQSYVV